MTTQWVYRFDEVEAAERYVGGDWEGERGGDPKSIDICHELGLDYVSCSPFRVPIARLAAAHAALKDKK